MNETGILPDPLCGVKPRVFPLLRLSDYRLT
jgi:hypothetical protein